MVASGVVLRTLATRGRKREAPRRQAWGDGAKRKVRRTMPLANTALAMKKEGAMLLRRGGMERSGRSEGQYRLRLLPIKNMASKPTDSEAIFLHRQPTIRFL